MTSPEPTDAIPDRWVQATVYGDMWVDPDDDPREHGTAGADERGVVLDYLADLGTVGPSGTLLRDVLVHMIEEYARHSGHADLLRERIDGRVGQ
jgi:Protein of unknown function (DUF664)